MGKPIGKCSRSLYGFSLSLLLPEMSKRESEGYLGSMSLL